MRRVLVKKYLSIFILILAFLLTRLPRLNNDILNTDAVHWHKRSESFITAVKSQNWKNTYQKYHPGVSLMWIAGSAFETVRAVSPSEFARDYQSFEIYHYISKVFLVFVQLGLIVLALYLLNKVFDFTKAFFVVLLFSLEPFFVGNSRLLHLDILFTLLLFNGLILAYLNYKEFSWSQGIFSGLLIALAVLTKSVGLGAVFFVLGVGGLGVYLASDSKLIGTKLALKYVVSFFIPFLIFIYAFFPALWVAPAETLTNIFETSREIGLDKGHNQVFFGEKTKDPGILFYPLVYLIKLSPFALLGLVFCTFSFWGTRNEIKEKLDLKNISLETFLGIFYLVYLVFMFIASKKIDRYLLVTWPLIAIYVVRGYTWLIYKWSWGKKMALGLLVFLIVPLFTNFPFYFTYTSPLFLNAENANKIIGQKPFGVGIFDVRSYLLERHGPDKKVAISDSGPLKEIYGSFRVFDMHKTNPKEYELLILGPNDDFPEVVANGHKRFKFLESIYINGLEYWRVFRR